MHWEPRFGEAWIVQKATHRFDCATAPQHIPDRARRLQERAAAAERQLATAALNFGLRQLQVVSILLGTGMVRSPDRNLEALASPLPHWGDLRHRGGDLMMVRLTGPG